MQGAHATTIEATNETDLDTKKLGKMVANLNEKGKEDLFQVLLEGPDF